MLLDCCSKNADACSGLDSFIKGFRDTGKRTYQFTDLRKIHVVVEYPLAEISGFWIVESPSNKSALNESNGEQCIGERMLQYD